jgi:hypothetical protein
VAGPHLALEVFFEACASLNRPHSGLP